MKIYTVGRTSQSSICINDPHVSTNHAELLQLNNGDIILVDKNSSNGTYVNGMRITPGIEVSVRRGDDIRFADSPLNWSMVPTYNPDPNVRTMRSIGSHSLNNICLNAPGVSRFHASIKQTRDNKWYICDHSSNGTTVNGRRIPQDQWVALKAKDNIECAGMSIVNPVPPSSNWKLVAIIGAVAAVVALAIIFIPKLIHSPPEVLADANNDGKVTHEEVYATYANSTAAILMFYYYSVSVPEIPELPTLKYVWDSNEQEPDLYDGNNEMIGAGTGFFITANGVMVTNLHIAKPWLFDNSEMQRDIKLMYIDIIKEERGIQLSLADVKANGRMEYIYVIPHGKKLDVTNAIKCSVVSASGDKDADLAILQTVNDKLPEGSGYIPVSEISGELAAIGTPLFTMGFPAIDILQDWGQKEDTQQRPLQANGAAGVVTSNNDKYTYGFDAASHNGASGSPIFDQNGKLIGVVSKKLTDSSDYNFGVKAKYINSLLKMAQE